MGWDAVVFNGSWVTGGSSAGFFKRSECKSHDVDNSFIVRNHGGAYELGNIKGEFATAYLRYNGGCNALLGSAWASDFVCDGRVVLNFTVGNCTPRTPGPISEGTCTDRVSGYEVAMHVGALPASSRPPSSFAWSDHKVCSGMAKPAPNRLRPAADPDDFSCCPPDFCRGPQRHPMVPDAWGSCDFAAPPAAEMSAVIHSGRSYALDVTHLLQQGGPGNGSFSCSPTFKLFPTTTFITDGWDIAVELSNVEVQCVANPVLV